jgi:hypothetical protein
MKYVIEPSWSQRSFIIGVMVGMGVGIMALTVLSLVIP